MKYYPPDEKTVESLQREILGLLSSPTRMEICELLGKGVDHPDELAKRLKLRRQSIDKHLLALHDAGIVDRSAFFPSDGRPKISYSLTSPAKLLLARLEETLRVFALTKVGEYRDSLLALDDDLAAGRLDEQVYEQKRRALEKHYGRYIEWDEKRLGE